MTTILRPRDKFEPDVWERYKDIYDDLESTLRAIKENREQFKQEESFRKAYEPYRDKALKGKKTIDEIIEDVDQLIPEFDTELKTKIKKEDRDIFDLLVEFPDNIKRIAIKFGEIILNNINYHNELLYREGLKTAQKKYLFHDVFNFGNFKNRILFPAIIALGTFVILRIFVELLLKYSSRNNNKDIQFTLFKKKIILNKYLVFLKKKFISISTIGIIFVVLIRNYDIIIVPIYERLFLLLLQIFDRCNKYLIKNDFFRYELTEFGLEIFRFVVQATLLGTAFCTTYLLFISPILVFIIRCFWDPKFKYFWWLGC